MPFLLELSKIIDLPPSRISEIEHGKRDLKITEAVKAAQFLGVSLDELVGLNEKSELASSVDDNASGKKICPKNGLGKLKSTKLLS